MAIVFPLRYFHLWPLYFIFYCYISLSILDSWFSRPLMTLFDCWSVHNLPKILSFVRIINSSSTHPALPALFFCIWIFYIWLIIFSAFTTWFYSWWYLMLSCVYYLINLRFISDHLSSSSSHVTAWCYPVISSYLIIFSDVTTWWRYHKFNIRTSQSWSKLFTIGKLLCLPPPPYLFSFLLLLLYLMFVYGEYGFTVWNHGCYISDDFCVCLCVFTLIVGTNMGVWLKRLLLLYSTFV